MEQTGRRIHATPDRDVTNPDLGIDFDLVVQHLKQHMKDYKSELPNEKLIVLNFHAWFDEESQKWIMQSIIPVDL